MTIKIRQADLEADREAAVALFVRHLNPAYDRRRFEWLYRANPAGSGRLWMAVDGSTGDVVGTAGAFPRHMLVEGRPVPAWVLGDFCIDEKHRSLGPALQLQRACLEDLTAEGMPFCYDFPSRSMEAVYRRLGIRLREDRLLRLARVLRFRRKLEDRWGRSPVVRATAAVADLVQDLSARGPRSTGPLSLAVQEEPCGEEFSALARLAGPGYGVCVERSAEHLNWRYRDNPIAPHEIVCGRVDGVLVAYAVLSHEGHVATVVDVFGIPHAALLRALVGGVLARLRASGFSTATVSLLESHPLVALFRRLAFRPRAATGVRLCAARGSAAGAHAIDHSAWFLTHGDRDS